MFTKEQLIAKLELIIEEERTAIPLYSKYSSDQFFFRGFSLEKVAKMKEALEILRVDSQRHQEYFEALLSDIKAFA